MKDKYIAQLVTKNDCPFCAKAKEFLEGMEISYTASLIEDPETSEIWQDTKERWGVSTFPQVFIAEYEDNPLLIRAYKHIGGYDDLIKWSLQK